jgi:hypothetical protein
MQQRVTIIGEMADGSTIVEHVAGWDAFIAVALPLWHDSECERLTWHETPALSEERRQAGCWPVRTLAADVA